MAGRAGVGFGHHQVGHRLDLHAQQFVPHLRLIGGQLPATQRALAARAQLQRGRGLVAQRHRRALPAGGRAAAGGEVERRTPDHRPRVRRFHRAAQVAEQLQLRAGLPGEAQARRAVPVVRVQAPAAGRPGHRDLAVGVHRRQAGDQVQRRRQRQVVADVQHRIGAQVFEAPGQRAGRIPVAGEAQGLAHVGVQVVGDAQADGGHAVAAEQAVAVGVVQRGAQVAVVQLLAVQALVEVHREVVIDQPGLQGRGLVDAQRGDVADPGAARLRAARVDGQVGRIGLARIVAQLRAGQAAGRVVLGLAVAQDQARAEVRAELPAEVGHRALAAAAGVRLVAVGAAVDQVEVVVEVARDAAHAQAGIAVAEAAAFQPQLGAGRIQAAAADVVDRPAQGQRTAVEAVGPAQHLDPAHPQRFDQLVRRAAGEGQRQPVQRDRHARGVRARRAVDARAADRHLDPFVARRLRVDPGLVGQHVGGAGHAAIAHLGQVDHIARAGDAGQRLARLFEGFIALRRDPHRVQRGGLVGRDVLGVGGERAQAGGGGGEREEAGKAGGAQRDLGHRMWIAKSRARACARTAMRPPSRGTGRGRRRVSGAGRGASLL